MLATGTLLAVAALRLCGVVRGKVGYVGSPWGLGMGRRSLTAGTVRG